ncbi:MAG: TRAP transporter substrate-binding protein [Meiothermus sp.]|uniref:TRAP transporter substrate-binding protein n=1 Tax=Meiothermus sp. TaxID=1955249 RepID=UPI0025F6FC13|nr:TRAP transporter substrate-binding protein [Meiothermus sp.]MCS7058333.1 TRAP transporter substrate-binding protein [Meiothermus sp.]MCS7194294.1 TRAP transporter substrate-binding protein [Meiothermus sp.]MCX7741254.1 TRAP transporter substrate-binding protein [Meiothermus sp.]MDW8090690.1 TRAP transporter substrate-binding protein [Meiothermus sp.]MDW8482555.1 TRAP transporter substrate-binding protein [Meiothermus sp.]
MQRWIGVLVGLALGIASAQTQTWTMATPYPDGNFHTINIREFARDVESATQGRLVIRVNSGGSLLPHPQILPGVRSGQVQLGEVLISLLANENPIFALDSIPFLVSSYEDAQRLYRVSRPEIESWLSRRGMALLFSVPWPGQGLYTKQPVNSVADLRGVRFRAYNPATARIAELTGMVPTQVEAADIPQAFATGIVAAMITSASTGVDSQAWDFARYYYDLRAWIPKNMVIVNRRALEALSPADREALLAAARRAEQRGWQASQQEAASKTAILAQRGMQVSQPSPQLVADLRKVGETMVNEWLRRAGATGVKIYREYLGR